MLAFDDEAQKREDSRGGSFISSVGHHLCGADKNYTGSHGLIYNMTFGLIRIDPYLLGIWDQAKRSIFYDARTCSEESESGVPKLKTHPVTFRLSNSQHGATFCGCTAMLPQVRTYKYDTCKTIFYYILSGSHTVPLLSLLNDSKIRCCSCFRRWKPDM
jgi:hypothetical protein